MKNKNKPSFLQKQEEKSKMLEDKYCFNAITIASAIMMTVAAFLPFINVAYMGVNKSVKIYKKMDGLMFILMAIFVILVALLKKRILSFILGVICCVGCFVEVFWLFYRVRKQWYILPADAQTRGVGTYVLLLSGVGLLIGGFIMLREEMDERIIAKASENNQLLKE